MTALEQHGPFDLVLDVGGNLGEFAAQSLELWPGAQVVSFEPIPLVAERSRARAGGRWRVVPAAVSDREGAATLNLCRNQHTASTLQEPGPVRAQRFRIQDQFVPVEVETVRLDTMVRRLALDLVGRVLLKIDVEGHELPVLEGAAETLERVDLVVLEVQNDPGVFLGAAPPELLDATLRGHGLYFAGLLDALKDPQGRIVQFDGVWARPA